MTEYKGWIIANLADKKALEEMGVIVGPYVEKERLFSQCVIPENKLDNLLPHWGTYFWELKPIKEKGN